MATVKNNNRYLHENDINGYIPDNQFRSRDPRFDTKTQHYGRKSKHVKQFTADEFEFDGVKRTCRCPAGQWLPLKNIADDANGRLRIYFQGKLSQCRDCPLKAQCMRNPNAADHRKGHGRQVSFLATKKMKYTEWMKRRVNSALGKLYYSHRMSVVEPIFGNIEHNKGLKRFSLRGKAKEFAQWQMFCLVHNIEKLNGYGQLVT